jgi:hypothetical protein
MRFAAFGKERKSKRFLSLRRTYSSSVMLRSDVVAGMPDNLFAHVGWHFGVSQPRNKTVTKPTSRFSPIVASLSSSSSRMLAA